MNTQSTVEQMQELKLFGMSNFTAVAGVIICNMQHSRYLRKSGNSQTETNFLLLSAWLK